jgi:HEAT repeat protein/Sel1 repeat-containing protein
MKRTVLHLAGVLLAAGILMPVRAANEIELKDASGATILKYIIEVPEGIAPAGTTDPAKQVGLILCSQEHDTPTGNDLFPVRQSLIRQGLLEHYVLIAPAPQGRKFGPADHAPIEKLIAWAKKTYPVNPRRVYMYGKGEGSKISMEFTMTHPDLVTAAIGYSWGAWLMPSEVDGPIDYVNQAPEIYLTLGRRDLANHLSCVRDAYVRLSAKGYHLIYREFDELGDRTYHPPSNDDALGWATRLRNKNLAPSAEENKLLKAFSSAPPAPVDGYYPALALVGGAPAGGVLVKLFESRDAHVRAAAAETCRHGIFGDAATVGLARLVRDPSPQVRRAAIRALAMYANWRYAAAQNALVELAIDKSADPADRLNATDAIGYALRFQVKGVRQDPPLFRALVGLLQDKDEPVRSTAAGILAPVYEFGGDGPQRKRAPEGGWEKWLDSISAKHAALPVTAFQQTLQAAESGSVQAQSAVGMMYADGKGVRQNYAEAAKWWVKAAEGGDLDAGRLAWNLYRNGEGVDRDPAMANQMAKIIGEPVQTPRTAAPAK